VDRKSPLLIPSRIVSGVTAKNAVGITSFSEAFTCLVGIASYLILRPGTSWHVAARPCFSAPSSPFRARLSPCAGWPSSLSPRPSLSAAVFLGSWSLFQALR
jgi:hypothetical protein